VSAGSWTNQAAGTTNLYAVLDEKARDDSDYAQSNASVPNDVFEVHLTNPVALLLNGTLKIAIGKKVNNSDVVDFAVELRQGSTTIASWAYADVPYGLVERRERLTDAQFAAITDFTDLRVRVTSGQFWTPAVASGADLVVWTEIFDDSTVTVDSSGDVASVAGKGGASGISVAIPYRPTFSKTAINWKPGALWNGAEKGLAATVSVTSASLTLYAVAVLATTADNNGRLFSCSAAATADFNSNLYCGLGRNGTGEGLLGIRNSVSITGAVTYNTPFVVAWEFDGTTSRLYINGASVGTPFANSANFGITQINVGAYNPGAANWGGAINGVIVDKAAPTAARRQYVEGYLAWATGSQSALTAAHPYKNRPPFIGD
jgi:hypothetical protein